MVSNVDQIHVLVADDHPVVRQGIITMLSTYGDVHILGEAFDTASTMELLNNTNPDILILDMKMPGQSGLSMIKSIKQLHPDVKIVVLTIYDDEDYINGAIAAGVEAYLLKCAAHEELIHTLREVYRGEKLIDKALIGTVLDDYFRISKQEKPRAHLTKQEIKILDLASQGMTNSEIAKEFHYSEITVKQKFQSIYRKLDARSKTHAVSVAMKKGLI